MAGLIRVALGLVAAVAGCFGDGGSSQDLGANQCGECPTCPAGTVCFAGDFVPECLVPCRDDRDCGKNRVCIVAGFGAIGAAFCGLANQIGPPVYHPTYCTEPPCSPPFRAIGSHCVDTERLATYVNAYCGWSYWYCPNGCEAVAPMDMNPNEAPSRGRCR